MLEHLAGKAGPCWTLDPLQRRGQARAWAAHEPASLNHSWLGGLNFIRRTLPPLSSTPPRMHSYPSSRIFSHDSMIAMTYHDSSPLFFFHVL